jgi:phosphate-selective porin OprO/OprP
MGFTDWIGHRGRRTHMQRVCLVLAGLAIALAMAAQVAQGQQASDDVNKKLDAMMKRLEQQDEKIKNQDETIKRQQEIIESLQKGGAKAGGVETLTPKQEKQVEQLVSQYLNKEEVRVDLGMEGVIAGYKDGFFLASRDQSYKLKFTGYMQADARAPGQTPTASTFLVRRARPTIEGTLGKYYNFKVQPDFGMGVTRLRDAYIDLAYFGDLSTTRLGKFKGPQGLEQLTSSSNILFVERSLVTNIAPDRDVGVMMYGKPFGSIMDYSLAILNGDDRTNWQGQGTDTDRDNNKSKDFAGRLQVAPFSQTDNFWLKGLQGAGFFMIGDEKDVPAAGASIVSFSTGPGTTFFRTNPGVTMQRGIRTRAGWDAAWFLGPVLVAGEMDIFAPTYERLVYAAGAFRGRSSDTVPTTAWLIQASWLLTGEDATLSGVKPKKDFDPRHNTWGAFELASRFSRLFTSESIYTGGYALRPGNSAGASEVTLGLNWYLNKNVKLMFDWVHTTFDQDVTVAQPSGYGFASLGVRNEDAFMFRTQVKW